MYHSLYQIIEPKVEAQQSGILKLIHASGQTGSILLEKGIIAGFVQGESAGFEAANIMLRWISVAAIFSEEESMEFPQQKQLNTSSILDQLKKIDERVTGFKKLIGGCEAIFQFIGKQITKAQPFSQQEINLSLLLDGTKSIKEIQKTSELSELDLLLAVCKFSNAGLLKEVFPHLPMIEEKRIAFIDELQNTLSDITGPVASVIINDAFESIGAPPEKLAECDISHLFSVVSFHLEDDERDTFLKWANTYSK